jgi:hypothetical protein
MPDHNTRRLPCASHAAHLQTWEAGAMSAVILPFDDRGRSRITPPILPAYKHSNGIQSIVWCQFCQRYHWHGPGHRVAHCGSRGGPYTTSGYVLFDAVRSGWTKRGIKYIAVVEQTGGVLIVAKSPANTLIPLAALDAQSSELPTLIHKQPASTKLTGNREAVS